MKKLALFCLVGALTFHFADVAFGQGNPEAAKLAREGFEAAKNKDWDKAVEAYRKAARLDQKISANLSAALQQRATAYIGQQKFDRAIPDLSEALKINPDDASIRERRAYAEMQLKDYDKALADYSELIKDKPDEVRYYQTRSYIYELKGDVAHGLADCDKILELDPENADAKGRKLRLEAKQGAVAAPTIPQGPVTPPPKKP